MGVVERFPGYSRVPLAIGEKPGNPSTIVWAIVASAFNTNYPNYKNK
jgi:hypothetical protein